VKMTSALRYFGLLMLIGMLITGFRVGWTPAEVADVLRRAAASIHASLGSQPLRVKVGRLLE
jgi:hypothetical protein